jgi:predicted nucleotidyltransferase
MAVSLSGASLSPVTFSADDAVPSVGKGALAMSATPQVRNEQMNRKQKVALQIIAAWADRFACVKTAVIFGSVARGDEKPGSDLDLDLQYVDDLTGRMVVSYTKAHQSFAKLRERILCATGHRLKLCNYMPSRNDHVVRDAIKHGIAGGEASRGSLLCRAGT